MTKVNNQTVLGEIVVRIYNATMGHSDSFLKLALIQILLILPLSVYPENDISYDYPDIPLIEIYTRNNEEPSCRRIESPGGCFGVSITDNVYVQGNMKVWMNHKVVYSSYNTGDDVYGMKLKIRGNTTGAYLAQHPYKIKLNKKADLFFSDNPLNENKEWVLLSIAVWNPQFTCQTTDLTPFLGASVSKCLGTAWTPRYRFVNLVMNGTYRGCYILAEAVNRSIGRIDIEKSGFIIEYDAYWWKPEMEYFKTGYCYPAMAFTFKYPDDDAVTDSVKSLYCLYMNEVEQHIYNDQTEAYDYIDYASFARWLLVHDILGSTDAAGSNIFLYKESMDPHNHTLSLLNIGPTWDYDTCFKADKDSFSTIHSSDIFYFNKLLQKPLFIAEYLRQWQEVKDKLFENVRSDFETLFTDDWAAVDRSITMSRKLYKQSYVSLTSQYNEILGLLKQRLQCLESQINTIDLTSLPKAPSLDIGGACYYLTGIGVQGKMKEGLYIIDGRKVFYKN